MSRTPTLTPQEFIGCLQEGTLPRVYFVEDNLYLGDKVFKKDVDLKVGIFKRDVFLEKARFEKELFLERARFEGRVYAGNNPAIAWQISQSRQGIVYSVAAARYMCQHPQPMVGWRQCRINVNGRPGNYIMPSPD